MPTKIFTVLDAVIVAGGGAASGNLSYTDGSGSNTLIPLINFTSLVLPGSVDLFFNETALATSNLVEMLFIPNSNCQGTFDINYIAPITGIPEGAMIKKLTYRAPFSINVNIANNPATPSATEINLIMRTSFIEPGIGATFTHDSVSLGPVNVVNQANPQLVNELINEDADIVVFDFSDPVDYLTRDVFVQLYSRVQDLFSLNPPAHAAQWDLVCSNAGALAVSLNCIYNLSKHAGWTITVEYEAAGFSFALDSPPANRAVEPGDEIEFSSDPLDPDPMDFDQIETITIDVVDAEGNIIDTIVVNDWVATTNSLVFEIPEGIEEGSQNIIINVTSTQFSGTVALQTFYVIYFYNAPGVYTLVTGRTHDTYYDRTTDPIGTVDTKIPNPTGRTGFY